MSSNSKTESRMKPQSYQLRHLITLTLTLVVWTGCAPTRPTDAADPQIETAIRQIRAVDNHAHPVRYTAPGETPDRYFDALPVDNMDPQSDPVNLRPDLPAILDASKAMYAAQSKADVMKAQGVKYPEWVLDQIGVETMLANRVEMGPGMEAPRFRWVPYADALMYPLDTAKLAARNNDRKAFFGLEGKLLDRYLKEGGLTAPPAALADYLAKVVTPTLERHRQGGAVAEKFEVAYLRSLQFDKVDRALADRAYASKGTLGEAEYKPLQDFLFRYIAAECGRLGMAVHIHTMAGAGGYFDVAGANPLLLEPLFDDPELRKTNFVMVHGGWPFINEITALLTKPNAYLDFSGQTLTLSASTVGASIRQWLEYVPEKVMYATDAYPFSDKLGWEESGWITSRTGRAALARALTGMVRDGEITQDRAVRLANMVLRDNAKALYKF